MKVTKRTSAVVSLTAAEVVEAIQAWIQRKGLRPAGELRIVAIERTGRGVLRSMNAAFDTDDDPSSKESSQAPTTTTPTKA